MLFSTGLPKDFQTNATLKALARIDEDILEDVDLEKPTAKSGGGAMKRTSRNARERRVISLPYSKRKTHLMKANDAVEGSNDPFFDVSSATNESAGCPTAPTTNAEEFEAESVEEESLEDVEESNFQGDMNELAILLHIWKPQQD